MSKSPSKPVSTAGRTPSRYLHFGRAEWRELRASTPLTLSEADLAGIQGLNVHLSLGEVSEVYLPLSRLLNLFATAKQHLHRATDTFLGQSTHVPFVIGLAGSVAVGKSTTARLLQTLLSHWPDHPNVALVTTDGFLHPNRVLETRGLMTRKGFPESYDTRRLLQFIADIKAGRTEVAAPVYSHLVYDIVPGEKQVVRQPDIVILEGLNVLQTRDPRSAKTPHVVVSDFFDFSIYLDAEEADLEHWYVTRFLQLRDTVFQDERSYFRRFAHLSDDEATETAKRIWHEINLVNLHDNIKPTRERAHVVLEKGGDHRVERVRLRKF